MNSLVRPSSIRSSYDCAITQSKTKIGSKPFSSKSLRLCYAPAVERFGWSKRPRKIRSMKDGDRLRGRGMASAVFTVKLSPASARVQLHADGTATVETASHDIGTGTYESLAGLAAQELGILPSRVEVKLADTDLPSAPASAGSQTSGAVGSAVVLAARRAIRLIGPDFTHPNPALHWAEDDRSGGTVDTYGRTQLVRILLRRPFLQSCRG